MTDDDAERMIAEIEAYLRTRVMQHRSVEDTCRTYGHLHERRDGE